MPNNLIVKCPYCSCREFDVTKKRSVYLLECLDCGQLMFIFKTEAKNESRNDANDSTVVSNNNNGNSSVQTRKKSVDKKNGRPSKIKKRGSGDKNITRNTKRRIKKTVKKRGGKKEGK